MALVSKSFVGTCVFVVDVALGGVVFVNLWGWFIVPLGAPAVGFWHALGIRMLVAWSISKSGDFFPSEAEKEATWTTKAIHSIVLLLLVWGFGALYHWLAA